MPEGVDFIPRRVRRGDAYTPSKDVGIAVKVMRANGTTVETIARLLRIDVRTLKKYYKAELAFGYDEIRVGLSSVIVTAGLDGDWHAALQWLRQRGGPEWQKTEGRLHGGLDGAAPIEVNARARLVILPPNGRLSLTEEEIAAEREAARAD